MYEDIEDNDERVVPLSYPIPGCEGYLTMLPGDDGYVESDAPTDNMPHDAEVPATMCENKPDILNHQCNSGDGDQRPEYINLSNK